MEKGIIQLSIGGSIPIASVYVSYDYNFWAGNSYQLNLKATEG